MAQESEFREATDSLVVDVDMGDAFLVDTNVGKENGCGVFWGRLKTQFLEFNDEYVWVDYSSVM